MSQTPLRVPWQLPTLSPWLEAAAVVKVLLAAGHEAVFVGGCVRDHLLGLPCHDCDLATNASPDQVQALFPLTIAVGKAFGVIIVVQDGCHIEVASFRHDEAYIDGRRPTGVRPGDEAGDMQRRDFTINALVADPQAQEIRDHVGGLADLKAGVLKVVGDAAQRLREDRLRILRALRFAARFDLTIDADSATALRAIPPSGLSRERMWDEWDKALATTDIVRWWELLSTFELLPHLLPVAKQDEASLAAVAQAFAKNPSLNVASAQGLILICCCLDEAALADWLSNEPISKERRQSLLGIYRMHQHWLGEATPSARLRMARESVAVNCADCLCALGHSNEGEALRRSIQTEAQRGPIPPLLNGADLKAAGISPGPAFAKLLRQCEDAWLLGEIHSRDQALSKLPHWIAAL